MSSAAIIAFNQRNNASSGVAVEPKKSNHQANIVRITEILPHPDPETTNLELIVVGGYQVVVRKGEFKVGDLGVYIQPDSVVPQTEPFRFIWGDQVGTDGNVPEKRRRITVRKFRKEWSEGLLLPLHDFFINDQVFDERTGKPIQVLLSQGDDVSDILGITHYDPDAEIERTTGISVRGPKKKFRYPKTLKGWLKFLWRRFVRGDKAASRDVSFILPKYDVEAYKNYKSTFKDEEIVFVSEKIHGSNARFVFVDGEMYAGSREQWKVSGGSDVWNKALKDNPWIEQWCRANEGYALYGEVTPTQSNKGFVWDYGKKSAQFFVFDILTPEKTWFDKSRKDLQYLITDDLIVHTVPVLYVGPFTEEKMLSLVDGPSQADGAKHIREGVVIKTPYERNVRGLGRAQLKVVSNQFLQKDSK